MLNQVWRLPKSFTFSPTIPPVLLYSPPLKGNCLFKKVEKVYCVLKETIFPPVFRPRFLPSIVICLCVIKLSRRPPLLLPQGSCPPPSSSRCPRGSSPAPPPTTQVSSFGSRWLGEGCPAGRAPSPGTPFPLGSGHRPKKAF